MIQSLVKVALFLVAAILVYNYFWGTSEEKEQSQEVFSKTKDAVGAAWNLLRNEKQKFDAGKYDKVMEQLGDAYKVVREQARFVDEKVLQRLDNLETRKRELESEIDAIEQGEQTQNEQSPSTGNKSLRSTQIKDAEALAAKAAEQLRRKEKLLRELDSLIRDTDALLEEAKQH